MAKKTAAVVASAPTHILTHQQWKDTPNLQRELQALLDSSIFQLACQTLLVTAIPNARPVTDLIPGVSAEAMALADSNRYHNRSGFSQFYRAIHNLARPKNTKKIGAGFGELLPEEE